MLSTRRLPDLRQVRDATPAAMQPDAILAALHLLRLAEDLLQSFAVHNHGRLGVSSGRLTILFLLEQSHGSPPRLADLARRASVSRPTVTRLVAGLERAGLVAVRPDADDGRARRVELTAAGRALMRRLTPVHARRLATLTHALGPDDRRDLERLLDKIRIGMASLRSA